MRLSYDPVRQTLRLILPPRASLKSARQWAQDQQQWVDDQLAKAPPLIRVEAGTCLPWGEGQLLLDWAADRPRAPRLIDDGQPRLILGGPEAGVGRRVGRWLRSLALTQFTDATHAMAAEAGLQCTGVAVGDPRRRWGSCASGGHIRYSWRIIMAPRFVQTALVAHEVAHLAHMDHGPDFHRLVDDLVGPVATQSRHWLRANGAALHRWRFD